MSLCMHQETGVRMFIAALLLIVITKKNPTVQENGRMNNKMLHRNKIKTGALTMR